MRNEWRRIWTGSWRDALLISLTMLITSIVIYSKRVHYSKVNNDFISGCSLEFRLFKWILEVSVSERAPNKHSNLLLTSRLIKPDRQ